jgi:FkbM family methyltransferase
MLKLLTKKFLIILAVIFLILLYFIIMVSLENIENEETITKKIDGTQIIIPKNKWFKDFKSRFINHESNENIVLSRLLSILPKNHSVIDVGSHVGDTGLYLAVKAKEIGRDDITIIMIDPDKGKIDFIKDVAKLNGINNIFLLNFGVGDKSGKGYLDKALHPGAWKVKLQENEGDFNIERLDSLIPQKYRNIGILHLDVEGMEHEALLGANQLLNTTKFIMIEMNGISDRTETRKLINSKFKPFGKNKGFANGNELYIRI